MLPPVDEATLNTIVFVAAVAATALSVFLILDIVTRRISPPRRGVERGGGRPRDKRVEVVEEAVARLVAERVLEGLRSGRFTVSLRSPECPGEVVFDLSRMGFRCEHEGGELTEVGGSPEGDRVREVD